MNVAAHSRLIDRFPFMMLDTPVFARSDAKAWRATWFAQSAPCESRRSGAAKRRRPALTSGQYRRAQSDETFDTSHFPYLRHGRFSPWPCPLRRVFMARIASTRTHRYIDDADPFATEDIRKRGSDGRFRDQHRDSRTPLGKQHGKGRQQRHIQHAG